MTYNDLNTKAQALAELVRQRAAAGESPDDLFRLVYTNVKVIIMEAFWAETPTNAPRK